MTEERKADGQGRQPEGKGGRSFPESAQQTAEEVAGRSRTMKVTCWNCGSTSLAYDDWTWVTCWKCGALFGDKS